jgi:6,7-dimethyl-8-ribityllumazine synthase
VNEIRGRLEGEGRRFALAVSRFNELVTERLVAGARACLLQHGVADDGIDVVWVPGAWELPGVVRRLAHGGRYAGVIALGCVIRGETPHFDYVAGEAAAGVGQVARGADVPVTFGVLTTEDAEQALARAGGKAGNKGWDAALAALEMADLYARLEADGAGA